MRIEVSSRKFTVANCVIGAFIAAAALLVIRDISEIFLAPPASVRPGLNQDSGGKGGVTGRPLMFYAPVLEKNPFGRPAKLQQISLRKEAEIDYGSLSDLVLIGTAMGPQGLSYAIFVDKTQSSPAGQDVFAYGEEVFHFGTLKKINKSSVEIERDSRRYTVTMPADEGLPSYQTQGSRSETQSSFARQIGEKEYLLDSRKVQDALANPEQILTDARLLPNIHDGKQEGFTISEVVDGGLYHSLGLRNGDVLLKINGLEISNPEVAMQALSALQGMNTIDLDIIRDGRNRSMNYQIR